MVICEAEDPCFSGTYESHGVRQFLDGSDAASCNLQQEVQLCGPPLLLAAFGELYHQYTCEQFASHAPCCYLIRLYLLKKSWCLPILIVVVRSCVRLKLKSGV